jgi:type II secretory pathway predicted ATPase ExeA
MTKGALLMSRISKLETLVNFGFADNPFRKPPLKTGDGVRIERILKMAVKERAMVSVVGDRGTGKTCAVTTALQKMNVRQVIVRSADKSRLLLISA